MEAEPKGRGEVHAGTPAAGAATTREEQRRLRREEQRRRKEIAYRRAKRRATIRRALTIGAGVVLVGAVVAYFVFQSRQSSAAVAAANDFAVPLGCSEIQSRPDRGRDHLGQGETFDYQDRPATSGPHSGAPMPPEPSVHTAPQDETRFVHNLEHGYILIYYPAEGGQPPQDVLTRLEQLATGEEKVLMAPHPDLPSDASLALAAWERVQTCPSTISAENAATVAGNFIDLFRSGGEAPEATLP